MDAPTNSRIVPKATGLLHGGDYNPEQWDSATLAEDDRLMDVVGWNEASMGIFSWVSLEPEEGKYTFDWLDERMDAMARHGRIVGLATPSAAQPAWMSLKYPEILRTGHDGVRRRHGHRVNFCWTSPRYREKTAVMARALAERYKDHPALGFWHVSNEYGGACYCDLCGAAFRDWLKERHGTLEALNAAHWTAFWGHTFTDWEQIETPTHGGESSIIGLYVDWKTFVSDRIVDFFRHEASALREITPDVPVTTNLMGTYPELDAWKIAPHMDFAAWDSYPFFSGPPHTLEPWISTSFSHDLCRTLKGKPFLLMECSPSSSNWYPVMGLKRPGMHLLEGIQAVAHGSDGVQYFQWRQGRGSSEQFHGAVVAHNQREDARVFRDVADLGALLKSLSEIAGSTTNADVALIYDWECNWAIENVQAPRREKRDYKQTVVDHYRALLSQGIACDVISSECDLTPYRMVVAPMMFMLKPGVAERLSSFVEAGGTLLSGYWSAVVNESVLAFLNGGDETWKRLFGIWVEEIDARYADRPMTIRTADGTEYEARDLCELIHAEDAEVLATYAADFYAGRPAVTSMERGAGRAVYVASRNDDAFLSDTLGELARSAGVAPDVSGSWPEGVVVRKRVGSHAEYVFVLNFNDHEVEVALEEPGLTVFATGDPSSRLALPSYGHAVLVRGFQ